MGPATLSSGMLQINVFTDLFFASGIVGAAAGLGYANLLVQTPLGLISNALLVPLLPTFARLTAPADRPQLIERIRQGLMLSAASMIPLGGLFIALGGPIVALVYERGAFDASAAQLVTGLLMAYGLGMPAYLGRDVLVRVFYALGDGTTPFRLSLAGIGLNVVFDWLLVGGPTPLGQSVAVQFRCTRVGACHGRHQPAHLLGAVGCSAATDFRSSSAALGPGSVAAGHRRCARCGGSRDPGHRCAVALRSGEPFAAGVCPWPAGFGVVHPGRCTTQGAGGASDHAVGGGPIQGSLSRTSRSSRTWMGSSSCSRPTSCGP